MHYNTPYCKVRYLKAQNVIFFSNANSCMGYVMAVWLNKK